MFRSLPARPLPRSRNSAASPDEDTDGHRAGHLFDGERVVPTPFRSRLTLIVVTGTTPDPRLIRALPALRRELGLTASRRR